MRDPFDGWQGRGQFAGHETFPLRLLWLKKAYDAVIGGVPVGRFHEPDAIAEFGVGRNMAVAMRYWALAARMIKESDRQLVTTPLGDAVLGEDGYDPFIERAATVWLVHWTFASEPSLTTTIFFAFNGLTSAEFDGEMLINELSAVVAARGWRAKTVTLKRDIEVFLRGYVRRDSPDVEDAAEPLMAELSIIRELRSSGWYEFVRGPKPTLPDPILAYAILEFWQRRFPHVATLPVEQICYAPGSPGRVFKLDEDTVVAALMRCEEVTDGAWLWTETAGLRQIQRRHDPKPARLLAKAYSRRLTHGVDERVA